MTQKVSIPSNGSIQFLPLPELTELRKTQVSLNPLKRVNSILTTCYRRTNDGLESLNPLKRVNSILTRPRVSTDRELEDRSQSPQTGQFNSYDLRRLAKVH